MCGDLVGKHQTAKPEPRKQTRSHLQGDYHVQPSLTTKLAATPFIALLFAAAVPTSAYAATYDVAGELNTGGHLVQYSTFRSHIEGGASLHIYNNVGTYSRFGLRNTSGSQVTNTNQYNGSGGDQAFTRASNGSTTIPTGSYAINGRMGA